MTSLSVVTRAQRQAGQVHSEDFGPTNWSLLFSVRPERYAKVVSLVSS